MLTRDVSDWYPVGWADQGPGPLEARVDGARLAVWQTPSGWSALEDRCPHRNAPLSAGKVSGGRLVCAYHGWAFDGGGRCAWVPSLGRAGKAAWGARHWPTQVVDGLVFVGVPNRNAPQDVLGAGGHRVRLVRTMEAPLDRVAENILDVPHTGVLHGGLFRQGRPKHQRVQVKRGDDRVVVRYPSETPKGLIARLFGRGAVEHEDEFRLPGCAIVRYRRGHKALVIASWLAPEDEKSTRMFSTAVLYGMDRWAAWLERLVLPVAQRILDQDAWVLRRQTEAIDAFGGPRFIHAHDPMGRHIERLRRDRAEGRRSPPFQETVEMSF
ncbi:MAG: Rieske 2Fe-2S domain-containing protein [Myxococcota bacterium]